MSPIHAAALFGGLGPATHQDSIERATSRHAALSSLGVHERIRLTAC